MPTNAPRKGTALGAASVSHGLPRYIKRRGASERTKRGVHRQQHRWQAQQHKAQCKQKRRHLHGRHAAAQCGLRSIAHAAQSQGVHSVACCTQRGTPYAQQKEQEEEELQGEEYASRATGMGIVCP